MAYKGSEFLKEYKRQYQNISTTAVVLVCILTAVSGVSCKHEWKMATYHGVITDANTGTPIKDVLVEGVYTTKKEFRPFDPGYVGVRYHYETVYTRTRKKGEFQIKLGTWRPKLHIDQVEGYEDKTVHLSDYPAQEKLHIELKPKTEAQNTEPETAEK